MIFGVPLLACIFLSILVCVGTYLLVKPQAYKDELSHFEDVISKWPRWLVRVLGLALIVFAGSLFYLFSSRRIGEVATSPERPKVRINFVFPDKDGVIGTTEDTPANNVRVLLTAVGAYEARYNSLPPSLSSLGPPAKGEEANRNAANLIDSRLALGNKNGYVFRYLPNEQSKAFFITADPSNNGSPASAHFFSDQTGVVRVESGHAATGSSQPYDGDN